MIMIVTPWAPVRGHVLNPTGNTTKTGRFFQWLRCDEAIDGAFCSVSQKWAHPASTAEVSELISLSRIGKR